MGNGQFRDIFAVQLRLIFPKANGENGSLSGDTFHCYLSIMHLHIFMDQMQTDTCPHPAVLRIETVEEIRQILRLDTRAIVFDMYRHPFVRLFQRYPNLSPFGRKLKCIG